MTSPVPSWQHGWVYLRARVSQILGGGENLTLRTLAAMSAALDAGFVVQLHALKPEDGFTSSNTADQP